MKRSSILRAACTTTLACALGSAPAFAQQPGAELSVHLESGADEWRPRDASIRLTPSRPLQPDEGRFAVLIGATDLTDLFEWYDRSLVYQPRAMLLPPGENELAVFVVTPDGEWREAARMTLRVLTDRGFEQASFAPQLDAQGTSTLDHRFEPEGAGVPPSDDASMNLMLNGTLVKNDWRFAARIHTLGVSEREKALRYGDEGDEAPLVDLSDYSLRIDRPEDQRTYFELGHVTHGQHRHLMPGFASRGAIFGAPIGAGGAARFAALSGTSIVGWNNITGLARSDHRILSAGLGWQLVPTRPGALSIDVDYLDGSLLPRSAFNAGTITDAETSQSWGVRAAGSTESGRLRFDAGFARSRFHNPFDPTLAFDLDVVPVREEERDARYVDLYWDAVQNRFVGRHAASLSFALRHERIDPQYRTVAAFLQSDIDQNVIEMTGLLGPLQLQLAHARAEDNLDDLPSVLTTKTRRSNAGLGLALSSLFVETNALTRWLPILSYNFDRTHQFGTGVPINSGFNESHVPDQVSARHGASASWQGNAWMFGYRVEFSEQDNRQPGREQADFEHRLHGANLSLSLLEGLDVNFDVSFERSYSVEALRFDRNRNYGFGLAWNITKALHFAGSVALTESFDQPRTNENESTSLDLNLSYRLHWKTSEGRGVGGQIFVRYSDLDFSAYDRLFGFDSSNRTRIVIGGINFSMQ
ncbi:MAG: hypothetical protein GX535_03505 [Xanthomonadaceae bacterium]|nr:hypothetical protein [Xanthomonadaceae bacterium]